MLQLKKQLFFLVLFVFSTVKAQQSALVYLGNNNKLEYQAYANFGESNAIHKIPDFSWAGYKLGGVKIPTAPVVVTLNPLAGDNRAQIQAAINQVSALPLNTNGIRGAILLNAGTYNCSGPIYIRTSGIVLRGVAQDYAKNGGTQMHATGTYQHDLIQIEGTITTSSVSQTVLDTFTIPQRIIEDINNDEKNDTIDGEIWLNADVTAAVLNESKSNNILSLLLTTNINDFASFHSKESTNKPYLKLNYALSNPSRDTSILIFPTDDAHVQGGDFSSDNFGTDKTLAIKYNGFNNKVTRDVFLKFQLPGNNATLQSATLFLYCNNAGNNASMPVFVSHIKNDNWTEANITYDAQPQNSKQKNRIQTPIVAVGSTTFEINDASEFTVGDKIEVLITPNQKWIDVLQMAQYGWVANDYAVAHTRSITHISGNQITVDIPMVQCIDSLYGGGEVYKSNTTGQILNCGIENLMITSQYKNDEDEAHGWTAVLLKNTENCWVQNVSAQFFGYSCVELSNANQTTVQDCAMLDPKSITTGSRKYSFNINSGSFNLFQRCFARDGRHDFITGARVAGPNVFVDNLAVKSIEDIGPHHRYATGTLFDNISGGQIRVQNRKDMGTGHGWAGAQTMFWNLQSIDSDIKVESPPSAMNWSVGCKANIKSGNGKWESWGTTVTPRSLYLQQLQDRLGNEALENCTTQAQRTGNIYDQLEIWAGLAHRKNLTSRAYSQNTIPGKIECEHFDLGLSPESYFDFTPGNNGNAYRMSDVDLITDKAYIETKIETSTFVSYIQNQEFLNYTILASKGTYQFTLLYASAVDGTSVSVQIDNEKPDTLHLSSTGTTRTFKSSSPLSINISQTDTIHLKLVFLSENLNVDKMEFSQGTSSNFITTATEVQLFPNPTQGMVTIQSTEPMRSISLYDALGKQLQFPQHTINANKTVIDLPKQAGIYMVKVVLNDLHSWKGKVLVK